MKEEIITHNFKVWQDPQCDPIIEFVSTNLFYYFKCWKIESPPKNEDFLGLFYCKNVERLQYTNPYKKYPYLEEGDFKCYYYEVKNSIWLEEWSNMKLDKEPNWRQYDSKDYKHFILMTRDSYLEIISTEIEFQKVKKKKSKIKLWNKI